MVVDGVLIPVEMRDKSESTLKRYAAKVKKDNGSFVAAYFKLEDQAIALGFPSVEAMVDGGNL